MKIFEELQSVGKALMLSVAVLPAAAILLRFGADDINRLKSEITLIVDT